MRDYKQMKEIQELKKQQASEEAEAPEAEAVPEEDKGENGKYSHRGPGFKGWLQYVWDYYKWPILIIGLIAVGVFVGIRQATANSNPDLSVTYVGPFYLSPDSQDDLRKEFADLCGEQNKNGDFNGDGEFRCAILDLTITYVKDADKNVYVYDEQNGAYTRFQTELRAGDTMLYFLDPRYYAEAKAEGVLQKLNTVIGDASLSFDGYGLYLGDLPCYSRPGFSRMPAGTVVCLRQTPAEDAIRYGRTEDSWKAHAELLKAMVKETDPAPEREPDAELLYVASEPAYRSVSEQIAKNAPDIPDANADGVSFLSVRSVCLNGRGGEARKASAEKAARTEIVAGKTFLWLLDEDTFRYALERDLLSPLPDTLLKNKAAVEGKGLLLSELPLAGLEGFSDLKPDCILCLRRSPAAETESYGRTEEAFQAAEQAFLAMAGFEPEK